jgi:glycosyltransferase involved in cell wall biosynthesis
MSDLPEISILVPVWNRQNFLPLLVMNLCSQNYPKHLLTVVIDDDTEQEGNKFITDLQLFKQMIAPIKVNYIHGKTRRSIGKKRHDLIKGCKTKIFMFMDSDDVYFPTAISHSYELLKNNKYGCVGSDKMLFCMSDKDYGVYAIDCGDNIKLIHEATIMATKKWYLASPKFGNTSQGEGGHLFYKNENRVGITNINKIMVCVQHEGNTVDKLQFATDDKKVNVEISPQFKNILSNILGK